MGQLTHMLSHLHLHAWLHSTQILLSKADPEELVEFLECVIALKSGRPFTPRARKSSPLSDLSNTATGHVGYGNKQPAHNNRAKRKHDDVFGSEGEEEDDDGDESEAEEVREKENLSSSKTPAKRMFNKSALWKRTPVKLSPNKRVRLTEDLADEQLEVFETVMAGKNLFFTGGAGTGKCSFLVLACLRARPSLERALLFNHWPRMSANATYRVVPGRSCPCPQRLGALVLVLSIEAPVYLGPCLTQSALSPSSLRLRASVRECGVVT